MFIHSLFARPKVILLAALLAALPASGAEIQMKVTDSGYLNARGFSVILYKNTYHPVFVDEKNAAMQMILHGHRIATNGDVRLVPTPEQWDLVAKLKGVQVDKEKNRLTAQLSFPSFQVDYTLEVSAEPGGVMVTINLEKPLPEVLAGRAGFNLEFLPSIYMGQSYSVDNKEFGMIPRSPEDPMRKVLPAAGEPAKLPYLLQWDEAKGYTQPLPLVTGQSITLAPEDPLFRVTVASETAPVSLYDGRDRAQNGWFVLRSLIPGGKTQGAIVWHIRPIDIPNWTRPPMVAHSQVGYAPNFPKIAVIELDPNFDAPKTAKVLHLDADGSYKQVFEGPISTPTPWLRYNYAKFDFSSVKDPGLYVIEYAGHRTALFPIAKDVYSRTWQSSLDGFLAVEMDHVSVRDAYRLWHGVSHLDDARQAPLNWHHFDGYQMGPTTDSPFKPGEHIPGLNVGGWFDAGDYDNIAFSQYLTIQNLALAYQEFNLKWDDLTVDETARTVEMHRPDGVPDAVEQVKHGILQVLAQIHSVGHPFMGIIEPTLRQYTHLGDAASNTDGRIYSDKLGPNQVEGIYSGKPDDRWAFTTKIPGLQYGAATSLAAASEVLKGWDDPLAKQCLDTAIRLWNEEHEHPTPAQGPVFGGPNFAAFGEWRAALELMIATHGGEPYKKRVLELFPTVRQNLSFGGWMAVRALPYMDADFKEQLKGAVKSYLAELDTRLAQTPFGVPPSLGSWGGSAQVAQLGVQIYFLHKAFPEIVGPEITLRAANYILGTHPVSSTSYVSSVGTVSKLKGYGNNRADGAFIPGGVIPGYIIIKPDFPECIDNFGFLWFEDEYTISDASTWILAANAANALVN
ncbi:MAG TPA: glycoside hydrolase family 9 protein [Terriglobia bacterium]|nr:glycoside hydrolase family 9 protein [Terriglobia bacterium]